MTARLLGLMKKHYYRLRVVMFPSFVSPFGMVWLCWSPNHKEWQVYGSLPNEKWGERLKSSVDFGECLNWLVDEQNYALRNDK